MALSKLERRLRIKKRIRKVSFGTAERPRLAVFRSNKEIYAQIINDTDGVTLVAASSRDKGVSIDGNKIDHQLEGESTDRDGTQKKRKPKQ
jgi:large subunit ribosomal protein L18